MSAVAKKTSAAVKRSGPTPEQVSAADPSHSAWVSASAGSGKTFVLARRVLRLLRQGVAPGRILCLTFTKAAAAEMARRVFAELGRWSLASDADLARELEELEKTRPDAASLAQARRLFAEALETPGGLKIQTIHAFAERVLHRFPFEANVPAHFEVLDDATASELREQAQSEVLAQAGTEEDGALARALDIVAACTSDIGFFNLLGSVIARRGDLERWIADRGGIEPALAHLAGLLGAEAQGDTASMQTDLLNASLFPVADWPVAIGIFNSGTPNDHKQAARLGEALDADGMARWDAYLPVFFTDKGPRKDLMTKGLAEQHPDLAETLEEEQARLMTALERLRAQQTFETSAALLRLGHAIITRYGALKTARGLLDFDDLIAATLGLLTRREAAQWVLYKLDGGIDHILIDEAQDTSPAQWAIVAALAEEAISGEGARGEARTIFAVGDEKQSIYSFQGADPAKFDEMRKFFEKRSQAAGLGWRMVPLTVSFRSGPAVLEAVDRVFAAPAARAGLAAGETPIVHTPHRADAAGLVEIWPPEERAEKTEPDPWDAPLDRTDMESPRARLALRIAATINHWLAEKKPLEARGRPIQPGDILVLVRNRKRSDFINVLIAQLRAFDIPVAGADRLVVQEHIAVMDLMTAGDVALLPEDDLSLATLLKSPLGGLGEEALLELAARRKGSLWEALQARREEPCFAGPYKLVAGLLARADFTRPFDFFAALLGGTQRGRAALLSRLGPEAGDAIDEFLALAIKYEQTGTPSLQGFLSWMRAQSKEIKREMDQAAGEVRIMTVHGAKGLEAPIVILPDACDLPDGRHDGPILSLGDGEDAALVWARGAKESQPEAIRQAREELQEKRLAEYRRLLYVAMTRAEDRLYVCGAQVTKEPKEGCWHELISNALGPFLSEGTHEADGGTVHRLERGAAVEAAEAEAIAAGLAAGPALPDWALTPAPPPPAAITRITPSRFITEAEIEGAGGEAGGRDFALHRGNLIHRLLETLPGLAEEERGPAADRLLQAMAGDLDDAARGAIAAEALALMSDPALRDLFGPSSRAEVALAGEIDSPGGTKIAISGQIDRLTVGESEVVIADYKSNRVVPERAESIPPAYVGQLAAYRLLMKKIFPGKAIRALIVWTAAPGAMEVPGAMLDAAEARGMSGTADQLRSARAP